MIFNCPYFNKLNDNQKNLSANNEMLSVLIKMLFIEINDTTECEHIRKT